MFFGMMIVVRVAMMMMVAVMITIVMMTMLAVFIMIRMLRTIKLLAAPNMFLDMIIMIMIM